MSDQTRYESILAVDIGSALTHVCLIDCVEGSYRLVAHAESATTVSAPESDVTIGLTRALRRIEYTAQRQLLDNDGELITPENESGAGVDVMVATANAAPSLRTVIIGLTDDLSIESAQRACFATNVVVNQTIALGLRMRRWDEETLAKLTQARPEVVILTGGIDTSPTSILESAGRMLVSVYSEIEPDKRPIVILAGNQEARRPLAAILDNRFDYRVVDNVRPRVESESLSELQRELSAIYERVKLPRMPGYRHLSAWCGIAPIATSEGLSTTLRFIARRDKLSQGILGIDVGGTSTHVAAACGDVHQWAIGAGLGTSLGIARTLSQSGLTAVTRWLPVSLHDEEVVNRLENARLRPHSVPQTMEDLVLTHALARQAILLTIRTMRHVYWRENKVKNWGDTTPAFDVLAARGGTLTHTPQDGLVVLTLLDAVQPIGLTRLVIDWASIWPQLGAVARIAPLAASQVLGRDSLRDLGVLIAPIGEVSDSERAIRLRITYEDGRIVDADVPGGTIQRFPPGHKPDGRS